MKCWKFAALLLLLLLLCVSAGAEGIWTATDLTPATEDMPLSEDVTQEVLLNGMMDATHLNMMRDGNYRSIWESAVDSGVHQLRITPPEGKTVGGLVIKWRSYDTVKTHIQVKNADGEWRTVAVGGDEFIAQYIPLPDLAVEFRIVGENPGTRLQICEIVVMTTGRLPQDFQLWQSPPEKVDLMHLVAHPDDELLWFGGMLPTYAGEEKKDVLVVCAAFRNYHRRLEMLDGLWTAGVKYHPLFIGLEDLISNNMFQIIDLWGRSRAQSKVVTVYRKYKPDVVVLQDINGEYGHGVHKAFTNICMNSVELAAGSTYNHQEIPELGTWEVPKVYIHLYKENQIKMDWKKPLASFGGKTGLEVATEAFRCHVTQQGHWDVWDGGDWDNSLFGLWHTTVGPDVVGGDMFENIDKLYAQE